MDNEIKEKIYKLRVYLGTEENWLLNDIVDYITNLQEENKRLKEIAHKMHLWIFLHSGDEQKAYDEIGLTKEENVMLGYSGQFRLQGESNED